MRLKATPLHIDDWIMYSARNRSPLKYKKRYSVDQAIYSKRVIDNNGRTGPEQPTRCNQTSGSRNPNLPAYPLSDTDRPAALYRKNPLLLSPASNSATCNNWPLISWWITRNSEAPFTDASLVVFLRLQLTQADLRTPAEVHLYIYFLQPRFVSTSANDIQRSTLLRRQQPDVAICKQPVYDSSVE